MSNIKPGVIVISKAGNTWISKTIAWLTESDGGNPQTLHFRTCRIRVTYSNDSIHYSRLKCSCSMSGMMKFIAQYGILPYDTQPKIYADGEVDWNKNPKSWKQVYEKYGKQAAQFKIRVAKLPRNFDDIIACLKAGYAIPYGTNKKLVLDKKTGWYHLSGSTAHCMCWSGFGSGFTYNKNSWLDGRGKERLEDVKVQVNGNYFDCFVILDIERTRESKPNYAL